MASICSDCLAAARANARYCSVCGKALFQQPHTDAQLSPFQPVDLDTGYRSRLRETSYLAPEYLANVDAALSTPFYAPTYQPHNQIATRAAVGRPRNPVMVMVLPYLTFGLYAIFWWWRAGRELRAALNSREPNTVRDLCLLVITGGLWRLVMHYNYAARIIELQQRHNLPQSDYLKIVCPLLSAAMLGFIAIALMQWELNKIWEQQSYGRY